jgi:hypothetical protein
VQEIDFTRWQLMRRLCSLYGKLRHWHALSRNAQSPFAPNHSQIRAFSSALCAVGKQIKIASKREGASLRELRMLTLDLLGLFRVWEYLRSKLAQRLDSDIALSLKLADDFAWSCFEPIATVAYKEPPLVFLNGGYSPYMVPRHKSFQAEYVICDTQENKIVKTLTSELPFPVIGLPWYQASAVWDLPLVAHEVGHAAESDLKLDVAAAVGAAVPDEGRRKGWVRWAGEVFADFYGTVAVGPAFVSALASFLASMGRTAELPEYPPAALRFALNLKFLPAAGADRLQRRWANDFIVDAVWQDHVQDCAAVANALAALDIRLKPMTAVENHKAALLKNQVVRRYALQGAYDNPRVVVSAIRQIYDHFVEAGDLGSAVERTESLGPLLSASAKKETRLVRGLGAEGVYLEVKRKAQAARSEAWTKLLRTEVS